MSVEIRRARADDVDFLVELVTHEDVEPFLAAIRPGVAASDRASACGVRERCADTPCTPSP